MYTMAMQYALTVKYFFIFICTSVFQANIYLAPLKFLHSQSRFRSRFSRLLCK